MRTIFGGVGAVLLFGACATTRAQSDEARLDDAVEQKEAQVKSAPKCGTDPTGDVVLLDGRTGAPIPCLPVTISARAANCVAVECDGESVFVGRSGPQGHAKLQKAIPQSKLVAVAEGYAPSGAVTGAPGKTVELELVPENAFWLKVLDADGNYLPDVQMTFRVGDEVLAKLTSNGLANVIFSQRQPFAGQAVIVEAPGYAPTTINGTEDLGKDGHTLVLRR